MKAPTQTQTILALLFAAVVLGACSANNGDGSFGGGGSGGGSTGGTTGGTTGGGGSTGGTGPVDGGGNDGTSPCLISAGGTALTCHFVCTRTTNLFFGATTETGVNGLIGAQLTPLLDTLGATTATALLNSVVNKGQAIDGTLDTHSTFALTAGLGGVLDSVDQTIFMPPGTFVPAGGFAVFAVQFPAGTVDASIMNGIDVTTFLGTTQQETMSASETQLDLLGTNVTGDTDAFIGLHVTKPYTSAQISLNPAVISANVGDAMHVNEMCTSGVLLP